VSDIVDELEWRGLIADSTDRSQLRALLSAGMVTLYAGFDPTGDSLHAGHLIPLLSLRRFQQAGHRPIVLAGGATGMIGDPSGRETERVLLSTEEVDARLDRLRPQLCKFLDFDAGKRSAVLVDNLQWTRELPVLSFLRDIGKHFSVNVMLGKEAVSVRLAGGGISYTEFSYMLLQAYDYLQLFGAYDCRLQIGGSDQWGNITAGIDLIRRVSGDAVHGLTLPLVTSASGEKFGKSTGGGNLWLDPDMTSPYAWYQYWVNVDDRDVMPYLRYFTFLDRDEVGALERVTVEHPAERTAQRRLAAELTTLVHGADETAKVVAASSALFGQGMLGDLDEPTLSAALAETPTAVAGPLPAPVTRLLVDTGLSSSTSEAKRTIAQGGAYVNNEKVTDQDAVVDAGDFLHGSWLVLRRGRRNLAGVRRE
jgi:tyrosyl-tRNA synthetase